MTTPTPSEPDLSPSAPGPRPISPSSLASTSTTERSVLRAGVELFLISFLILFFELACIRWFGSTVDLPDVLHQHRADGLLPGRVGRLPGGRATVVVHRRASIPLALLAVAAGLRRALGLPAVQPGDDRRRRPAVAAADLLRHRRPAQGPVAVRRSRSRCSRAFFFVLIALMFVGPRPGDGPAIRRGPEPGRGLHGRHPRAAWRGSRRSALSSYFWLPAVGLVRARAWRRRCCSSPRCAGCSAGLRRRWPWRSSCLADWPRDAQGVETEVTWSPYYQVAVQAAVQLDRRQQPRPPGNAAGRAGRAGLHAAAPAEPRRRRQAVRGRADHRRGSGNDVAAALRRAPSTSTPSRSTR